MHVLKIIRDVQHEPNESWITKMMIIMFIITSITSKKVVVVRTTDTAS